VPFDEDRAARAVAFCRICIENYGRAAGASMTLLPWFEQRVIRPLYGTIRSDGTRQYRKVFVAVPKKNAKTINCGALALYMLRGDGEFSPEVFSAASDIDQASLIFDYAHAFTEYTPALDKSLRVLPSRRRIVYEDKRGVYRVLSSESKTKHGVNPHALFIDELHAHPNAELFYTLTKGSGIARRQPLFFIITTAGFDRTSICYQEWEYARKVARGEIDDPRYLSVIYETPDDADIEDPKVWASVNPALGTVFTEEDIAAECREARKSPRDEAWFRTMRLNQWTMAESRWIDRAAWMASSGELDMEWLRGRPCYGGLDLAATKDFNALALVFPSDDNGPPYRLLCEFWLPEVAAQELERRYNIPMTEWHQAGLVNITPGGIADHGAIYERILALREVYQLQEVAYDPYLAHKIVNDLSAAGMTMVKVSPAIGSMSPPSKEWERLVGLQQLWHGGNPVLAWMNDSCTIYEDINQNIKPIKPERGGAARIDGIWAGILALDRAIRHERVGPSVYEGRGILTL